MPKGELHVELAVNYADDDKLADVSRSARLLYVDALCKCKATLNDGKLTRSQVEKLAFPETPVRVRKLVAELTDSGAFVAEAGKYLVSGWLKRNKSKAQITAEREAAQEAADKGNHQRWHIERGEHSGTCRFCVADPIPDESLPRSGTRDDPESGLANPPLSPETETETETEKNSSAKPPPRLDVEQICERLVRAMIANRCRKPTITTEWREQAKLLIDKDKRPLAEILRVIAWAHDDSFWKKNIHSVPTLRRQYDKVRIAMEEQERPARRSQVEYDDADEAAWR